MPARRIGWRMERRVVRGVVIVGTGEDEAIFYGRRCRNEWRGRRRIREEQVGTELALRMYSNIRRAACAR